MGSEGPIFESAEQFEEYRQRVRERLESRRSERSKFLIGVVQTLESFRSQAETLGLGDLARELAAQLNAAREALGEAPQGESSAVSTVATAVAVEQREAVAPAAPRVGGMRPVAPAASREPARPRVLRGIPEIDAEVGQIEEQLSGSLGTGEAALLRLKAMACRQRRAFWELDMQGAYTGHARALYGRIKGVVMEQYGDRRVLPLHTGVSPAEPVYWERLAARYEALIGALDAYAWYRKVLDELPTVSERELLESIAAVQQQVYRMIDRNFPGGGDDQQRTLYEELLRTADERQVFLESLNARTSDDDLVRIGEALPKIRQRLESALEKKRSAETAAPAGAQE